MNDAPHQDETLLGEAQRSLRSELSQIPRWSVAAAAAAFVIVLYLFLIVVPEHEHHHAPFGLHLYFSFSWAALSGLYMLMVGYIMRDTRRRAMHARMWILICFVLPGGIGAVLYFLLRRPVIALCPACRTRVQTGYHFCPQCAYQLSASCARCYSTMDIVDRYCVSCGHDRLKDATPDRLYAFRDEG